MVYPWIHIRWCLQWHSSIPFQPSVSGQRQIHLEYAEMEDFEGTKHAEYSKKYEERELEGYEGSAVEGRVTWLGGDFATEMGICY